MKKEDSRKISRWTRSLRALLVIAIVEWKRVVFTFSFVLVAFLPPLVVLLYPSTYDQISESIKSWHDDKNRQLRSPHTTLQLSVDSNISSSSEINAIRYAVLDQSTWVHQKITEKLLRNDLQMFLHAMFNLDESEFAQWAQNATDELSDTLSIRDRSLFQNKLIEFHHALIEDGAIRKRVLSLAERLERKEGTAL